MIVLFIFLQKPYGEVSSVIAPLICPASPKNIVGVVDVEGGGMLSAIFWLRWDGVLHLFIVELNPRYFFLQKNFHFIQRGDGMSFPYVERSLNFFRLCTTVYSSGRQPPGRGPMPVREEFVAGPYHFPG